MKNLLLIIPILFFLNITEIKVISYNIRYNNSNDGINIWENRRSTIKNFIVDVNPDFAGLQEVTYSQLIFLTKSLKDYDYILASEPNSIGWKKEINKLIEKNFFSSL